ncbi:hypothetical protein H6788_01450 [Candidatus Nomurabacteria bacterium]|nr:hypothetical protein [Candidatus Nomurabacteria bacterium]
MKTIAINLNYLSLYGVSLMLLSALALTPLYSHAQINVTTSSDASSTIEFGTDDGSTTTASSIIELEVGAESTSTEFETEAQNSTSLRVNADGDAIAFAADVKNDADLEVFAHNISETEENVSGVEVDSEENGAWQAEVSYEHEGKLFGLMQVTLKSKTTVEVNEGGELEVHSNLPWWNFLVTKKNHAESEIESRLRDNATIMAAAEVEANAAVKAQVVEAVVAELNAHTYIYSSINAEVLF